MRFQFACCLSFLLFNCSYLNIQISLASGHCLDDQRSLLLQLKNNLTFNPLSSSKLVLWNQSLEADCCNWKGVFCDKEGHVTGLDLSEEHISGELSNSSSLFSLIDLQNLNLASNQFNSVIPSGFQKLTKLSYLNLSDSGFVGQIPIEISHLTKLVVLDISTFSYSSEKTALRLENPNLAKLVQNLTQVRELYLDGVLISDRGNEWCNALSSSLPHLHVLSMSNCNLSGPIDSSLEKLKSLSVIRLDNNDLSAPMPEFIANFSNLTSLYLSYCGLNGIFPQAIFKVQTLASLDISGNQDLNGYLPDFPQNSYLQTLILSDTNFSGALPYSISNSRQLSRLECSSCQFNGTIPYSISTLKELTYLDLSGNDFKGPIPSLGMAKKLTHVDLCVNDLSGPISSAHFEGLQYLVYIDLHSNSLNGSIPSSLFALSELSNLSNSALDTIDLSSNNLEGPIPKSIFHLSNLQSLNLSSNKFNGTFVIHNLSSLGSLDLSHNNLSVDVNFTEAFLYPFDSFSDLRLASCNLKTFPAFLRNQSMLFYLDLSNNQIQGRIPNWIWRFNILHVLNLSSNLLTGLEAPLWNPNTSLIILDLHSNNFRGQLPMFPPNVTYLDWSNNQFNSVIPHNTVNLSFINFLSLSNNDLHGSIPYSFCNSIQLQVLDLSHNKIDGKIPQCLAMSANLVALNLADNMLYGNIPDPFSESCTLKYLHLHRNKLSGPLPNSLVNCKTLEVLDLGRNRIIDAFPFFLMNISTLHVISLRENKFHGSIECPTMIESLQMLQIVDLSFNNFSGRLPKKCFTKWRAMMLDQDQVVHNFDHIQFQLSRSRIYQDSVRVTLKGLEMQLVKILNVFTSIDFSFNHFEGPIPEELMNFKALYVLNLSHNSLSSQIPSSIGNLRQLESLDLSNNLLDGEIPPQLANLNFLSFLNLSFNNLMGRIPTGTQIQTFEETSFEGNELCGPPLAKNCSSGVIVKSYSNTESSFSWNFISSELGFTFGIGVIFLPLLFWKRWRLCYWKFADDILYYIFPQLDFVHECHDGKSYRSLRWKRR